MEADEFRTWVEIDDDMTVAGERESDDDDSVVHHIVESLRSPNDAESNNCSDDDVDDEPVEPNLAKCEMRTCLHRLQIGLETRGFDSLPAFMRMPATADD